MPNTSLESQTTLVVLIGIFIVVGVFALVIFLYIHKKGLSNLRAAFRQRRELKTWPNKLGESGQLPIHDLEKGGLAWQSGKPMGADSLSLSPACFHDLPRESADFAATREASIRSLDGRASTVGDEEDSESEAESSWTEIIGNFPCPPDAAHVRDQPEGMNLKGLGLAINKVEADTFSGNSHIPRHSQTAVPGSGTEEADAGPDLSNGRPSTPPVALRMSPLTQSAGVPTTCNSSNTPSTQCSPSASAQDLKLPAAPAEHDTEAENSHTEFAYL